jgi:hypothetical protein
MVALEQDNDALEYIPTKLLIEALRLLAAQKAKEE